MNNEEEKVINSTILNTGVAKPISFSKEEALKAVNIQNQTPNNSANNIATPMAITKEEIEEQRVNELNDLMKNDYVKLVEVKHSKLTYVVLFLILAVIIGIIIFEVIYYGGKM